MNSESGNKKNFIITLFESAIFRNILFTLITILLFLCGVIIYGIILNLREVPLSEAIYNKGFRKLSNANLVIDRKNYTVNLYEDTVIIKSYRASFGRNLAEKKKKSGDGATPVGVYKICSIKNEDLYYKFLRLNYPNLEDAAEALRKSWITQKQFNDLKFDFYYEECTNPNTILGGNIGIHGIGRLNYIFKNLPFVYNWTDGSIALSNESIDEILSVIKKGTKVVIK